MEELCHRCHSEDVFEDRGSLVCGGCGLVGREILSEIDDISHTNQDGSVTNNSHIGSTSDVTNPYETLTTHVPKGYYTKYIKDGKTYKRDLSKMHMIVMGNSKEKSFNTTVQNFDILFDIGKVPKNVIQYARSIWGAISEKNTNIYRGSNRNGILACCILYSCYKNEIPITRKDICSLMKIGSKDINNGEPIFRELVKATEFRDILDLTSKSSSQISFAKYLEDLNVPYSLNSDCETLYKQISTSVSSLKDKSLIGGILVKVITSKGLKKPNKKDIAEIVGITMPTLNKALKQIEEIL